MKEFQIDAKGADAAAQTLYFLATDRRYAITSCHFSSVNVYAGILFGPDGFLGVAGRSLEVGVIMGPDQHFHGLALGGAFLVAQGAVFSLDQGFAIIRGTALSPC